MGLLKERERFVRRFKYRLPEEVFRDAWGRNFFAVPEIGKALRLCGNPCSPPLPGYLDVEALEPDPVLSRRTPCWKTHSFLLVPPGLSLASLVRGFSDLQKAAFRSESLSLVEELPWAHEKTPCWQAWLVYNGGLPGSHGLPLARQLKGLPAGYSVLPASVWYLHRVLFFIVNHRLFELASLVRCLKTEGSPEAFEFGCAFGGGYCLRPSSGQADLDVGLAVGRKIW